MRSTLAAACLCGFVAAIVLTLTPLHAAGDADATVARVYPVADLPVWMHDKEFNPSLLIAHLKSFVDPESWDRGAIITHDATSSLVVRQTRANHEKIVELLTNLRPQHPGEQRQEIDEKGLIQTFPTNPAD